MRLPRRLLALAAVAGACASAQTPPASLAAAASEATRICQGLPAEPTKPLEIALRAQCVLSGELPSNDRYVEARRLARVALAEGDPFGGFVLYLAWSNNPANSYIVNGKPDLAAYKRLAARTLEERAEQVEAIEGLGYAAERGHAQAEGMLASYFYETVAPRNVTRLRTVTQLLLRNGEKSAYVQRVAEESAVVERTAGNTKASMRSFRDVYRRTPAAVAMGYKAQTGGKECAQSELKSVSSGDIRNAEFLPLKGPVVADTYLVKGQWTEFWTFSACGQDVPLKVAFEADGWGGSSFAISHNSGTTAP